MSSWLTADEQIKRVAARYPSLNVVTNWTWLVIWEGSLRSFQREYRVRIFWHRWWPDNPFDVGHDKPKVLVLDPPLQPRDDQPLDHVYRRTQPVWICPFDPKAKDWDSSQAIADTIIPFAVQWLCSYELWRVSGEWPAPGRHVESQCQNETSSSSPGRPALNSTAAFVRIGLMTGTFASSALMAAASGGFSRWLSLQDWNPHTFGADQSPVTSIILSARAPAGLSPWASLAA
jgi:hypothetical protein